MVLLVIDTQEGIVSDQIYNVQEFIRNLKRLIQAARTSGVEVIYVRHDDGPGEMLTPGNPEFMVYHEIAPEPGERMFDKRYNSAFKDTGLKEYLMERNEREVMAVGLQTDFCMDATIKSGFEQDLRMIVPADANSTEDNEFLTGEACYHFYNDFMWKDRYASCVSMEEALEIIEKGKKQA